MASGGAVMRNAALHSPWRRLGAPLLLSTALALGGCAALGGNVRGDFSCAAPDGVCAPSATIDDRALAMITADAAEGVALPADAAPRSTRDRSRLGSSRRTAATVPADPRSEEHTSELQSLMRISYAVFCLKTKTYPCPTMS